MARLDLRCKKREGGLIKSIHGEVQGVTMATPGSSIAPPRRLQRNKNSTCLPLHSRTDVPTHQMRRFSIPERRAYHYASYPRDPWHVHTYLGTYPTAVFLIPQPVAILLPPFLGHAQLTSMNRCQSALGLGRYSISWNLGRCGRRCRRNCVGSVNREQKLLAMDSWSL